MPVTNDTKLKNSLVSALQCLKCEICGKTSAELLPGLCASHMFCKNCADSTSTCPPCKITLNKKNLDVTLCLDPEILTQLQKLESVLINKTDIQKTPMKTPAARSAKETKVPQTPVASPAKSESTVASTPAKSLRGRKSSLGSPLPDVNKRNSKGETLLHVACIKKNFEEAKRLLEAGANSCVRDYNGWTPLHEAAQSNRVDIAQMLVEHGAKVNAAGGEEYLTPLHDAVSAGYVDMIKLLLKFGADPEQRSIKGETAREMTKNEIILGMLSSPSKAAKLPTPSDVMISQCNFFADGRPLTVMSVALDKMQKSKLTEFLKAFSGKLAAKPNGDIKVVVSKNVNNICKTSSAVLAGIAAGAWVVRPEWLNASIESAHLVDPESFELYGTETSTTGNVFRKARQNSAEMLPGLFAGCHFYLSNIENYGADLSKDSVTQIVKLMGGKVLTRSPDPEDISGVNDIPFHANKSGPLAKCSHYIIFEKGKTKKNFIEFNMQHIKALQYSWLISCMENFMLLDP